MIFAMRFMFVHEFGLVVNDWWLLRGVKHDFVSPIWHSKLSIFVFALHPLVDPWTWQPELFVSPRFHQEGHMLVNLGKLWRKIRFVQRVTNLLRDVNWFNNSETKAHFFLLKPGWVKEEVAKDKSCCWLHEVSDVGKEFSAVFHRVQPLNENKQVHHVWPNFILGSHCIKRSIRSTTHWNQCHYSVWF